MDIVAVHHRRIVGADLVSRDQEIIILLVVVYRGDESGLVSDGPESGIGLLVVASAGEGCSVRVMVVVPGGEKGCIQWRRRRILVISIHGEILKRWIVTLHNNGEVVTENIIKSGKRVRAVSGRNLTIKICLRI